MKGFIINVVNDFALNDIINIKYINKNNMTQKIRFGKKQHSMTKIGHIERYLATTKVETEPRKITDDACPHTILS